MGSKNKIAKLILPQMLEKKGDSVWVEPFVGGANMIDKLDGIRIGNDSNKYLISLLKAIQNGWTPPTEISKEYYYEIKSNKEKYPNELIGFVGFLCSFGGKWFGGYAANTKGDNYAERGSRCLVKQSKNLKDITFYNLDYRELILPNNSIIYCDPPYKCTTKYKDEFDHDIFWNWCRLKHDEGHTIFVSEYNAPDDFVCIKEVKIKTTLDKNSQYERVEKLFTLI